MKAVSQIKIHLRKHSILRKINLWLSLIAIIFTISSCDDMGDLFGGSNKPGDLKLKFTDKPVEKIKQKLESEGIAFMDELSTLKETQLFPVLEYVLEHIGDNENPIDDAALRSLAYELKSSPSQSGFKFHKKMKVETSKLNKLWGLYAYDFETNQIIKLEDSYNEIVLNFPSSAEQKSNNAKLKLGVIDSDIPIDWIEEEKDPFQDPNQPQNPNPNHIKYPKEIFLSIEVNRVEIFYADIKAQYFADGVPKKLRQSLKLEAFKWITEIENTGKKITENLYLHKGDKRLVFSEAVIYGNFSREIIERDFFSDKDYPDETFDSFSAMASVMDVGINAHFENFKGFFKTIRSIHSDKKLSPEEIAKKETETFNKYLNSSVYFVKEKKKFADIAFVSHEYKDEYLDYEKNQWVEYTNYDLAPVFVLNDSSRVDPCEFFTQGLDGFNSRLEDILDLIKGFMKENEKDYR